MQHLTPEDRAVIFAGMEPDALRVEMARRILTALLTAAGVEHAPLQEVRTEYDAFDRRIIHLSGGWTEPCLVTWEGGDAGRWLPASDEALAALAAAAEPSLAELIGAEVQLRAGPDDAGSSVGWVGVSAEVAGGKVAVLFAPAPVPGADDWEGMTQALRAATGADVLFRGESRMGQVPPGSRGYPLSRENPDRDAALVVADDVAAVLFGDGGGQALADTVAGAVSTLLQEQVRALEGRSPAEGLLPGPPPDEWLWVQWWLPGVGAIALALPPEARPAWVRWGAEADEAPRGSEDGAGAGGADEEAVIRPPGWELVRRIPVVMRVMLGRAERTLEEVLRLRVGDLIELDRFYDQPHEVYVDEVLIAYGETRIVEEREGTHYGVAITEVVADDSGAQRR